MGKVNKSKTVTCPFYDVFTNWGSRGVFKSLKAEPSRYRISHYSVWLQWMLYGWWCWSTRLLRWWWFAADTYNYSVTTDWTRWLWLWLMGVYLEDFRLDGIVRFVQINKNDFLIIYPWIWQSHFSTAKIFKARVFSLFMIYLTAFNHIFCIA